MPKGHAATLFVSESHVDVVAGHHLQRGSADLRLIIVDVAGREERDFCRGGAGRNLALAIKPLGKCLGGERGQFFILMDSYDAVHQLAIKCIFVAPIGQRRACGADLTDQIGISKHFIDERYAGFFYFLGLGARH